MSWVLTKKKRIDIPAKWTSNVKLLNTSGQCYKTFYRSNLPHSKARSVL